MERVLAEELSATALGVSRISTMALASERERLKMRRMLLIFQMRLVRLLVRE